ncbi:hypothetical protein [Singulisphaera sp. PoT]|uniref:hypothetical protein n=1 Tax=Singulisphaera sp. PoT TaxID=3411797 RepID=UPI003BF4D386
MLDMTFRFGQTCGVALVLAGVIFDLSASSSLAACRPTPPYRGGEIPRPPRQDQPWTSPGPGVSAPFAKALTTLFGQGMADPRGCEYREVVLAGDTPRPPLEGGPNLVTHAWVLPQDASRKDDCRFAVAWNGLVYPLDGLGDPADLDADIQGLLTRTRAKLQQLTKTYGASIPAEANPLREASPFGYSEMGRLEVAWDAVRVEPRPTTIGLLLRLGRLDLAREVWQASTGFKTPIGSSLPGEAGDPYIALARPWALALYDQALSAHSLGLDPLSLTLAREMARVRPIVEDKARELGYSAAKDPRMTSPFTPPWMKKKSDAYLEFIEELPILIADQERRAREKPGEKRPLEVLVKLPDPQERIAALIDSMAEHNYKMGEVTRDESVNMMFMHDTRYNRRDVTVQALEKQGIDAAKPLLEAFKQDRRLTRTVRILHYTPTTRHIVSVRDLAFAGILKLLGTDNFSGKKLADDNDQAPENHEEAVAAISASVAKYGDVSVEDRWYRILADDAAYTVEWAEVAKLIVTDMPAGSRDDRPVIAPLTHRWLTPIGPDGSLRGDSLRKLDNSTLSTLLVRRTEQLATPYYAMKPKDTAPLDGARELALALVIWDADAARPVVAALHRRFREILDEESVDREFFRGSLDEYYSEFTCLRGRLGDSKGLEEYASWALAFNPPDPRTWSGLEHFLEPFALFPHDPALSAAAEKLFNDPDSPWLPFLGTAKHPNNVGERGQLIARLVGIPAFRKMVVRELANREPLARFHDDPVSSPRITFGTGWNESAGLPHMKPATSPMVPDVSLRVCDYYAWKLGLNLDGIPPFNPTWFLADRDRVIAEQSAYLERFGKRYDEPSREKRRAPHSHDFTRIAPSFPRLDHPATPEDLRRGLCIFSAEGEGPRRVVPLPMTPYPATWTTFRDYGQFTDDYDIATQRSKKHIAFDQEGLIWQAEEVFKDGEWHRYYGFAGRRLARVPASEIELPVPHRRRNESAPGLEAWTHFMRGLDDQAQIDPRNNGPRPD